MVGVGGSHRIPVNLTGTRGWVLDLSPLPADWLTFSSDVILSVCSACRIAKGTFVE